MLPRPSRRLSLATLRPAAICYSRRDQSTSGSCVGLRLGAIVLPMCAAWARAYACMYVCVCVCLLHWFAIRASEASRLPTIVRVRVYTGLLVCRSLRARAFLSASMNVRVGVCVCVCVPYVRLYACMHASYLLRVLRAS